MKDGAAAALRLVDSLAAVVGKHDPTTEPGSDCPRGFRQQHKDLLRDALIHITIVIYPPLMLLALLLGLEF